MTVTDWIALVGAIAGGVVLCINTWGSHFGRKEAQVAAKEASGTLELIHKSTNSGMDDLRRELKELRSLYEKALRRIGQLQGKKARR